jgi:hypothetical protein
MGGFFVAKTHQIAPDDPSRQLGIEESESIQSPTLIEGWLSSNRLTVSL